MLQTRLIVACLPLLTLLACATRPGPFLGDPDRAPMARFVPPPAPAPTQTRLASGAPGPDYWQQRADYRIDATLDPGARRLSATVDILYTNNSPHSLEYLWLNLEQNLFRPSSAGSNATPPGTRFANRARFDGGYDIGEIRIDGREAVMAVHGTLGRLSPPVPIAPNGGTVRVSVEYAFTIPQYGADRMGIDKVERGTIFQLAQWFPNMCVYDDVHGWNTLEYMGTGEFYTNFGDYEVAITVPREFIVSATGVLENGPEVLTGAQRERLARAVTGPETVMILAPEEVGSASSRPAGSGALTWRFRASDVRTFAWAASDAFIWDACSADTNNGARSLVQSMYPHEATVWTQSSEMLRFAIEGYSERWFPYPYPSATNVNGVCGGMEYPMMLFCGARENEDGLYGVTTHEIGHNWFPMVVNTDERRHAWMDEGFDTFMNYYSWQAWKPERESRRGSAANFAERDPSNLWQPVTTRPDHIAPGLLGRLAYEKTAVGLVVLREQILEPDRFDEAFRSYIRRWAFKSPQPSDFFRCMEDAAGTDLGWFWRTWFHEPGVLDQSIERVRVDADEDRAVVRFANREDVIMPVHYRVTYRDGSTEDRVVPADVWATGDAWTATWLLNGRIMERVEIDPVRGFPDVDRSNGVWRR